MFIKQIRYCRIIYIMRGTLCWNRTNLLALYRLTPPVVL
nr:MAG TPA: hypothetical protein [Caudoviricetes sp.]